MSGEQGQPGEENIFEVRGFAGAAEEPEGGMSAEEADALMTGAMAQGAGDGEEARLMAEAAAGGAQGQGEGEEEEKPAAKIKIGSREFANADEAWAYAQELESEKLTNDAFRHGLDVATKAAQGNQATQQEVTPEEEEIPIEVMYDPKKLARWISEKTNQAKEAAKSEIGQEAARKQRNNDTWSEFYRDYPDLTNAQELVTLKLNENWERLKHVDTKQALKEIAVQARALKSKIAGDAAPGRELPQVRQVGSSGQKSQVTGQKIDAKPLSFVQQQNNLKRKRTARPSR